MSFIIFFARFSEYVIYFDVIIVVTNGYIVLNKSLLDKAATLAGENVCEYEFFIRNLLLTSLVLQKYNAS